MTTKQKEFLRELKDLLTKYKADIGWTCDDCSDTFGLSGDHLYISMTGQKHIDLPSIYIDYMELNSILEKEV